MAVLQGSDFHQAFAAATRALEQHREAINALNVYPVPDGDTGTNMLLTMRSAMEQCPQSEGVSVAEAASGLADGGFWGARGNSGVILSQFLRGFAEALSSEETCDGAGLARALDLATDAAYRSVGSPVEGTMLTVIRSAASAVRSKLDQQRDSDAVSLWETAFHAATEALYLTPSQLPVLKEAGVVDAGGLGVVVILGGALSHLSSRDLDLVERAVAATHVDTAALPYGATGIDSDYLDSTLDEQWGYCVQFLIEGQELPWQQIQTKLEEEIAASAVVVGDDRYVRIHVHAADPGPALSYGASIGDLYQISIENMKQQNRDFVAAHRSGTRVSAALAVVAVVNGSGLSQLFQDAGCTSIIGGGQTMNPSVGAILDAVATSGAEQTIVLPNNVNVVAAAEQAAEANPALHVVPTRSLPQGVSALLAFNPEESLEHNLSAMKDTLDAIVTIEVTQAVRDTTTNGTTVAAGQYIALQENELATWADTPEGALRSAMERTVRSKDQVITVFRGEDAEEESAEELRRQLEQATPGIQVDLVYGGQPHYPYLASVE